MDAKIIMDNPTFGLLDFVSQGGVLWEEGRDSSQVEFRAPVSTPLDAETLRRVGWEIGEDRPADAYVPAENHVGLAAIHPHEGFAHWRIRPEWVEETARKRGGAWHNCRLIIRLYDVSCIQFNGFNAHRTQDESLSGLCGQRFFRLPRAGTSQIAEVGFLLRNGEFIPAARSHHVPFAPEGWSRNRDLTALFVDERWRILPAGNVWEQEHFLREMRRPKLRQPLRIAAFTLAAEDGQPSTFIRELAAHQRAMGHEVHIFLPATSATDSSHELEGIFYHPLPVSPDGAPTEFTRTFARAADRLLRELPSFDLLHHHEWLTGLAGSWLRRPRVLSLTSLETTRRNGAAATDLSQKIEESERTIAHSASCVLTPDWLHAQAIAELGGDSERIQPFPMEGRVPNEWEQSLDYGQIKGEIGVGPLDRLLLFMGPLEHAAGVDLLIEALPVALRRAGNLRVGFIGSGSMHGSLEHRAHQLGVAHAVRLLGHREGPQVNRLVRAAEAIVLPSRCRLPFDDAVIDLARKAGRPVITTHGGPAHLVRHEENGLITYDNPGSMVWALDRLLGDPAHAERMGRNGQRNDGSTQSWSDVTRRYLELCAQSFPELTETDL